MKPVSDSRIETMEEVAVEGARQIKAFFSYQGDNPAYFQRAKMGAAIIGAYSRIRASETNRMAVELAAKRIGGIPEPEIEVQRVLTAAKR